MRKIISVVKLIRIHNCLMAAIGVSVGWYLAGSGGGRQVYLTSLAVALVCGAGNALNDFLDIENDRINHPHRPLPQGELNPASALIVFVLFNLTAIVLGLKVDAAVTVTIIAGILLLIIYNLLLKRLLFWGNIAVSILGGSTFLVGGLSVSSASLTMIPGPIVPAAFAFLFHLGRELLKDIADLKGDRLNGYRTLPSILSPPKAQALAALIFGLLILVSLIPILQGWYRPAYNIITIGLVDIPLIILLAAVFIVKDIDRLKVINSLLKFLMIFGLLAFILGKR
ncbi:MAG: geranylgeranylglycerol-phosphate geranylgeranyltransferase [candidate division Zixibacteria bacterium]|nr:geranylgeranylglycerol-phosphate geranylgeranyltransferase [candidate division Zixibacteria bacterium]